MDMISVSIIIFLFMFLCTSGILLYVLFKINSLTNNIVKIVSSFTTIETDLKLVNHEVESLKESICERDTTNKDVILAAINNLISRLESLQITIGNRLERIERNLKIGRLD